MLTEIEWWGGIVFIWFALCYKLAHKQFENKVTAEYIFFQATAITAAVSLGLFFYPLEDTVLKLVYIITAVMGFLSLSLFVYWPDSDEKEVSGSKKQDAVSDKNNDDEEVGLFWTTIGNIIFIFPFMFPVALAIFKSVGLVSYVF